jgi:hypothetical protein
MLAWSAEPHIVSFRIHLRELAELTDFTGYADEVQSLAD